jgi:hypothetical protein
MSIDGTLDFGYARSKSSRHLSKIDQINTALNALSRVATLISV